MPAKHRNKPEIKWEDNRWSVTLPLDDGRTVNATWKPAIVYVVRIREAGAPDRGWSFGFETPVASFTFVDLRPDTEYEVQVRTKKRGREGPPEVFRVRTGPAGGADNVVPFPVH